MPPNGPDDINELEMQLLQHDPAGLMLRYRSIVDTIVQMQINEGNIPRKEKEEFVHHILDAFLQRLPNILSQYNRRALLRTYCAAVFRNLCKDRIRQYHRQSAPRLLRESDMPAYNNPDPLSNLAIKEEVLLFGKVFSLFTRKKAKATLFLKAYFRLPLDRQDLLNYHPGLCAEEIAHWIRDLSVGEDEENIRLYRILGKLSRKAEGKSESAEAVRKWIRARLKDLVRCMNTSRDTRHTIETVRLLAERHFCTSEANAPELLTAMQGKE